MIRKSVILLLALAAFGRPASAQNQQIPHCGTAEYNNDLRKIYPQISVLEKAFEENWKKDIVKRYSPYALKSTSSSPIYDHLSDSVYNAAIATKIVIPLVCHIVHDYGAEYISDNTIYDMVTHINQFYQAKNDATNSFYQTQNNLSDVIPPFIPYIGRVNIEFRLAQRDPNGNATNGITRYQSYLQSGGNDQAKFDQWDPTRYVNIWFEGYIGQPGGNSQILAYATPPASAAQNPYYDGVISNYAYADNNTLTIQHELGHIFNLEHTWGNTNSPGPATVTCGQDDDGVDDTPPTTGHLGGCARYDTTCATGYKKSYQYDSLGYTGTVTVDYPDTVNEQNVMNYSDCKSMFTKGQVLRMHAALNSPVGGRNNLYTAQNLHTTGIDVVNSQGNFVRNDILPVPAYSIETKNGLGGAFKTVYMCADNVKQFLFKNRSWRDTVTGVKWEFSNTATASSLTDATNTVKVAVAQPGWVTVKLTATGNHTGDSTISTTPVYAADPNYKIDPNSGYIQEFDVNTPGNDIDKWPIFNYYNNVSKWQINSSTGYYDHSSIMFNGYDKRVFPGTLIGSPLGDRDDFFSPAFNLTGMTAGACNLNFLYAGCYRTTDPKFMNDTLEIAYSTDCGDSWIKMSTMTKGQIQTIGSFYDPYAPGYSGDWAAKSIPIPTSVNYSATDKIFFRFRFKQGVDYNNLATGNNFYMDRINVSPFTTGINTYLTDSKTVALAPNPSNGSSYVIIKGNTNTSVQINVTDITGKLVFHTQEVLNSQISRIEIPAAAIAVKGVYMVQVLNGNQIHTEKLVSY